MDDEKCFMAIQWNLINTNIVKAKYLLNTNHFEIPRHYNTNTTLASV